MSQIESRKPTALTDWAYETIKHDILTLKIPPGQQLRVEDLAEQLGTSRTPVREALLKMERDGLVQVMPRVGFFTAEMTRRDIQELFELRELLEARAAQNATACLTASDLQHLEQLLDESQRVVEQGNLVRFLEIDVEFHGILIERAGNRRLVMMMESIRDLTYRERFFSLRSRENIQGTLDEHKSILAALRRRDGQSSAKLMSEHLLNASHRLQESSNLELTPDDQ